MALSTILAKLYTFVSGGTARASEVNENFDYAIDNLNTTNTAVNTLETEVDTHVALTIAHGATNNNTANAIVRRDASGNFSAGTITATLSGNATSATSATSAASATNADKLDNKHWVTVVDSSVSVSAGSQSIINLKLGGAHTHYLVSVYSNVTTTVSAGNPGTSQGVIYHWIIRSYNSSNYDTLNILNTDGSSRTVYYKVYSWE